MGLDMYLYRKHYYGGRYKDKDKHDLKLSGDFAKKQRIDISRVSYIEENVGYWRKANAIHNWFVRNVQDGEDNCAQYYVEREQLQTLLDTIEKVLDASELVDGNVWNGKRSKKVDGKYVMEDVYEKGKIIKNPRVAQQLLPTTSGFFFGSTGYDEYYISDLKYTRKLLKDILKYKKDYADYYYQSSW